MIEDSNTTKANKGGRPRTGSLEWRGGTWCARVTVTVEGESIRKWVRLETDNKPVARRKLKRLLAQPPLAIETVVAIASQGETYSELAARVSALRKEEGIVDVDGEDSREKTWILPELGELEVTAIRADHIAAIYDKAKKAGLSQSTLRHLREVLRSRFAVAMAEELVKLSPLDRVRIPKVEIDRRERAVLTDEELGVYLAWQHPHEHRRLAVLQRQTMSVLARVFGGLRTGDLHDLKWSQFDAPDFTLGTAPRKKTKKPQRIEVPEPLRPILKAWWLATGNPSTGPVFPALRGEFAGQGTKHGVSHAEAMRRDLRRAFGIEQIEPYEVERKNRRTLTLYRWKKVREQTERETELLDETEFTRPVDFHSWRRAFAQALGEAGVNAQQAQKLSGHGTLAAHERYLNTSHQVLTIPAEVVPSLPLPTLNVLPQTWAKPQHADSTIQDVSSTPGRIRTCDQWIRKPNACDKAAENKADSENEAPADDALFSQVSESWGKSNGRNLTPDVELVVAITSSDAKHLQAAQCRLREGLSTVAAALNDELAD